jgi:hypothetical protein
MARILWYNEPDLQNVIQLKKGMPRLLGKKLVDTSIELV